MGWGRRWTGLTAAVALLALTVSGCATAPDPASWRVEPVAVGDINGNDASNDVIFTTWNLTDDTAGGVWGESAGSWFRVAADGTRTRFNEGEGHPLIDIAALSPTEVYLVRPIGSGLLNTSVELFDTEARSFTPVLGRSRVTDAAEPLLPYTPDGEVGPESAFGAVPAIDVDDAGNLVFAERTAHPMSGDDAFVVRRLDRTGRLQTLAGRAPGDSDGVPALPPTPTPAPVPVPTSAPAPVPVDRSSALAVTLTAASVSISAGADSGVVVSTPDGVFRVGVDGRVTTLAGALPLSSARRTVAGFGPTPYAVRPVDANSAGELILITGDDATKPTAPWYYDGGSGRFRELVEHGADWASSQDPGDLAVTDAEGSPLPPTGAIRSARLGVWTDDTHFVMIVPGSGESALARITLPDAVA